MWSVVSSLCLQIFCFLGFIHLSVSLPGVGCIQFYETLIRCLGNRRLNRSLPSCKQYDKSRISYEIDILKWFGISATKQSLKQQNSVCTRQRINKIENRFLEPSPKLNQKRRKRKIYVILDCKHTHVLTINLVIITCHLQISETIIDASCFI